MMKAQTAPILHKGTLISQRFFLCYLEICSDPPKFCPKRIDKKKKQRSSNSTKHTHKSLKTVKTQILVQQCSCCNTVTSKIENNLNVHQQKTKTKFSIMQCSIIQPFYKRNDILVHTTQMNPENTTPSETARHKKRTNFCRILPT